MFALPLETDRARRLLVLRAVVPRAVILICAGHFVWRWWCLKIAVGGLWSGWVIGQ